MHILEIKKEKKGRLLVRTDEVGTFPIYEKEAAAYGLEEGAVLSGEEWERLCAEVLLPRVKKRALHLLETQDRTEAQLRQKLREGHYPEFLVDEAVAYVVSYHYIDDLRYAASYIRFHQDAKSRRELQTALLKRGVASDVIEQAIASDYTGDEEELLERILAKRGFDPADADDREKSRTYQYLLRKGFSSSAIRRRLDLT